MLELAFHFLSAGNLLSCNYVRSLQEPARFRSTGLAVRTQKFRFWIIYVATQNASVRFNLYDFLALALPCSDAHTLACAYVVLVHVQPILGIGSESPDENRLIVSFLISQHRRNHEIVWFAEVLQSPKYSGRIHGDFHHCGMIEPIKFN